MRRLLCGLALLACSSVWAQQITIPPPNLASPGPIGQTTPAAGSFTSLTTSAVPFSVGTSLVPVYQNATSVSATTTNGLTTSMCTANCQNVFAGAQMVNGSVFTGGTTVTSISGTCTSTPVSCTITTNLAAIQTNASPVTIQVGTNRWSLNSALLANTLGVNQGYFGGAAQGNSDWLEQYTSGWCQAGNSVICSLSQSGASINLMVGALRSHGTFEGIFTEFVMDQAAGHGWNHYQETQVLAGANQTAEVFGTENDIANNNTYANVDDPFSFNNVKTTVNLRLGCGIGTALTAGFDCGHALDIINNGGKFTSGIVFDPNALDSSLTVNPPAISLFSGTNGQSIRWYSASGATEWAIYSTGASGSTKSIHLIGNAIQLVDSSGTLDWTLSAVTGGQMQVGSSSGANCGNFLQLAGRPSGQTALLFMGGCSDTAVGLTINAKGAGDIVVKPGADGDAFTVDTAAGAAKFDVNTSTNAATISTATTTLSGNLLLPAGTPCTSGSLQYGGNAQSGTFTSGGLNVLGVLNVNGVSTLPSLSGTTGSIGGGALLAGACTSGTVAVTSSTTAMSVIATPVTYPGDGTDWKGYVSSAGTVTVKVCGLVAVTPTATTYNVRVIQ